MGQYQQVRIGEISSKYAGSLTHTQLFNLLQEIKSQFESQLGFTVFDYSENGLPIDILYVSESQKKKRLHIYLDERASLQKKIEQLDKKVVDERAFIDKTQKAINTEVTTLNNAIVNLNTYVENANKTLNTLNADEYKRLKHAIDDKQAKIKKLKTLFKNRQSHFEKDLRSFQRVVHNYNSLINQYNALVIRIETLSKSIIGVKGQAIGKNITSIKTAYADGKKITQKSSYSEMEKIEIYGFDGNIKELKAILAHEFGWCWAYK